MGLHSGRAGGQLVESVGDLRGFHSGKGIADGLDGLDHPVGLQWEVPISQQEGIHLIVVSVKQKTQGLPADSLLDWPLLQMHEVVQGGRALVIVYRPGQVTAHSFLLHQL